MQQFMSKRHLIILGAFILFIGAAIPIATFAASPQSTSVTINSRCAIEGAQVLTVLNKGQTIEVSAVATGDDSTHEDEALSIFADLQQFIRVITPNTGPHSFEYTAKQNGVSINACWALVRNDDDGEYIAPTFFTIHNAIVSFQVKSKH